LDADLARAIAQALTLDRAKVHEAAKCFTWERTAEMFESWLAPVTWPTLSPKMELKSPTVHTR
jgi:hypothetical protein